MAKNTSHFCSECGYESLGWLGRCPACKTWGSMVEASKVTGKESSSKSKGITSWLTQSGEKAPSLLNLDQVEHISHERFLSGIPELDRVLGGGFIPASLVLLGGAPGMGKSTLLLQVCKQSQTLSPILYICGEESPAQLKLRANRLGLSGAGIKVLSETCFETIANILSQLKPKFVIVDSIQTMYLDSLSAAPGSLSQVREVAFGFLRLAKKENITICLVGHITKDGQIAGPRLLEHMVDTVLYFDGEENANLRILRSVKNRFGPTDEIGLFTMTNEGLQSLSNPSEALLSGRPLNTAGSCISASMQGTRPLLLEVQALLSSSNYVQAQRMTQGLDKNRVQMILSIMEKIFQQALHSYDAYVNLVGGLKFQDPALDLAIAAALLSSLENKPIQSSTLILGELGLTGEIRPVQTVEKRVTEAAQLGFTKMLLPSSNKVSLKKLHLPINTELIYIDHLKEIRDILFF